MAQIIMTSKKDITEFPFADEVHDMGDFIVAHPQILGTDIQIISRELQVGTADSSRRIDFLIYDTELNQTGIVELKKELADEKVLLQTLRYASWIRNNPDTVRYQIKRHNLDINPEEIDTETIKVLIVAPKIAQALAELCQYITGFDFEFIQLQRFKDMAGEVYAITNILEIETSEPIPARSQGTYDLEWYRQHGVKSQQMDDLDTAIKSIDKLCKEANWELNVRYVKGSVRFQTPGGRNAFYIIVRKTQNHILRVCLGPDFSPGSINLKQEIKKKLHHTKKLSRWWRMPLEVSEIGDCAPLLKAAYENILK